MWLLLVGISVDYLGRKQLTDVPARSIFKPVEVSLLADSHKVPILRNLLSTH